MTDRPILFSAPMIRALLAGTKTQTRRILKPPYGTWEYLPSGEWRPIYTKVFTGDRLWAREAWRTERAFDGIRPRDLPIFELPGLPIFYEASDNGQASTWGNPWGEQRRPSMFMPRWASRLTLVMTGVRVERLLDISEEDAIAEGIEPVLDFMPYGNHWKRYRDGGWNGYVDSPIASYASLWTEINGSGSWEANPFVAVISFRPIHQNIDQIKGDQ
ncbi:hypothetical protein [Labrys neptuniae]|uniref:Uncharacterized protein n=1 Tax=Labrys neptuniae TaxID=376174 RepID=A0ABV3PFV3_9HYPH